MTGEKERKDLLENRERLARIKKDEMDRKEKIKEDYDAMMGRGSKGDKGDKGVRGRN